MSNDNQIDFTVRVKKEGLGELASDLDKVEQGAKGMGTASAAAGTGARQLGKEAGAASTGVERLGKEAGTAGTLLGGFQAKVVALASATAAAVAGFFGVKLFAGAVQSAGDLEAALSRVEAATGASAEEMAALRKAAEDAGANTKFTSVEAAQALENLAKAGLNAKDAVAALPAVLALAQAGDVELGQSAEFVTKTVMGMGLAFTDAGRVADVLAMGANASNTSVKGLAEALSYAAPVAHSLGLSLETTVAIIGKFADSGIDASRAGTALNSVLSQFSDPASKFRTELAAIGITTTDFEKALHQLAAAGAAGEKAVLAVGMEAGPALRALLNQGMGALGDLKAKLDNAAGSAAAAAATMQNNLNSSLSGLASAWDTVKTALGTPVLPALKDGVDQLAGAFRAAVADGTVQRFGETIATAFKAGVKWVREFLGTVDFSAVLARMQAFANSANEVFTRVGEYAVNAGNTVKLAYGVMSAGANAVLTAIYGIGAAFTETAIHIVKAGISINEQLQKIAIGDAKDRIARETEQMRLVLEGLGDAGDRFSTRMHQSLVATGESAQIARDGFAGLAGTTQDAGTQATAGAAAFDDMGKRLEEARQKSQQAQKAVEDKAAKDAQAKQAAVEHAAAVAGLSKSYADAVAAGNWQRAAELQEKINQKLRETPGAGKDAARAAADTAAAIEASFRALGVTSSAELAKTASEAQRAYEIIKSSGTSTAQDIANAFRAAAERAIAANDGVAPAWVRSQAAVRGFRVESDDAGKSILRSMEDAEGAVGKVGAAAKKAGQDFKGMGEEAKGAGGKVDELREKNRRLREENDRRKPGSNNQPDGGGANRGGGGANPLSPSNNDPQKVLDYYDSFKPTSSKDFDKAVNDARNTHSGNVTLTKEYVDAQIAKQWGEKFIGDSDAMELFNAKIKLEAYRTNYGNVVRSQQSLNEQNALLQTVQRLEEKLRARQAEGEQKAPPKQAEPAAPRSPSSGSGMHAGGSTGGGSVSYVSNITLPGGQRKSMRFADADSQATNDRLLRDLAAAKGVAQ